jgi:DNA polymerase-3 subunit beta
VATDAHKLVRYRRKDANSSDTASFIVPRKALGLLKGALPSDQQVKIAYNASNAFFDFGNVSMICRLIDARYPDYNAVIPTDNPNTLTIGRNDLQNSLRRIAIFANKTTHQVILRIAGSDLHISAQDLDFSNEANERLACLYSGEDMEIGFNARFLIEMLGVLEAKEIRIELSTPTRAGIIVPIEQAENEEVLMLVMPVMVNA